MGFEGLPTQVVPVEFRQGLDTKTQQKLVAPGRWTLLRNLTLTDDYTLRRRDGVAAIPGASTTQAHGLATHGRELLAVNGTVVKSIPTSASNPSPVTVPGQLPNVSARAGARVRPTAGQMDSPDVAYGAGVTCYAWREKTANAVVSGLGFAAYDEATGAVLVPPTGVFTAGAGTVCPRVVFSDDAFFVFFGDNAANIYCFTYIPSLSLTVLGAPANVATGYAGGNFDACAYANLGQPSVALAYRVGAGVNSVVSDQIVRSAYVPSSSINAAVFLQATVDRATICGVTCCAMGETGGVSGGALGVFALQGTGTAQMWGRALDNSWAPRSTQTTLLSGGGSPATAARSHIAAVGCGIPNNTNLAAVYNDCQGDISAAADATSNLRCALVGLGAAAGNPLTVVGFNLIRSVTFSGAVVNGMEGPFIAGKPMLVGVPAAGSAPSVLQAQGLLVLPVCVFGPWGGGAYLQNSLFFIDGFTGAVLGKALYGQVGTGIIVYGVDPTYTSSAPSTPVVPTGWAFAALQKAGVVSLSATGTDVTPTGVSRLTLGYNTSAAPVRTELGPHTHFANGMLSMYDGAGVTEEDFNLFPEGTSAVDAGGAGGSFSSVGPWQLVAIYEWTDGAGVRHQSAPSVPVSVTLGATNHSLTVKVPMLHLTQRTGIQLAVYGTAAAGTTFTRWTLQAGTVPPVDNSTTTGFATFTFNADVTGGEALYTQPLQSGTTLPNLTPAPASVLAYHQQRLWVDRTDAVGAYGYSQQLVTGVGLQWSPLLGGTVPTEAGDVVGFADMDDKVFIFCQHRIFAVYGTGPTASGGYSNYSDPVDIQSDVGCIEARSILSTAAAGILFKAEKGWYLLGRDLAVQYIGDAVAEFDAYQPTSAVLLEDRHEVRFSYASGPVSQLVYSYLTKQWSSAVILGNGILQYVIRDALWWPTLGAYVSCSLVDGVNQDTPGTYSDAAGGSGPWPIPWTARTGFFHLGALEGFQRVKWLYLTGTTEGPSPTDSLTIAVDFDDMYQQAAPGSYTTSLNLTAGGGGPEWAGPPYTAIDMRHPLRRQKCKSVAFTFTDSPASANAPSVNLQALALVIGVKRGTNKLPAAQGVP